MLSTCIIGSKQYLVSLGSTFRVEKLDVKKGESWEGTQVLFVQNENGDLTVGQPLVEKAGVKAKVLRHGKDKKILIVKKKRRKGYRRTQGHRQDFTEILIEALADEKGTWHTYKPVKREAKAKKKTATPVKKAGAKKEVMKKEVVKKEAVKKTVVKKEVKK